MSTETSSYDASQIKVLKGLEPVRKSPGMYIGDTGMRGYHHCLWEICDNSIDEHLAGHCARIDVTLHKDGSVSVKDDGRGIPVDIHKEAGISAATVVMTTLSAGGKFENESGKSAYKVSGGLHGVGASVVNALSTKFEMTIERDGGRFYQCFVNGGQPKAALERIGNTRSASVHGTEIRFWLDETIFKAEDGEPQPAFDKALISRSLATRAHLNPGLTITFTDERDGTSSEWNAKAFEEILDIISDNRSTPILPVLSAVQEVETKAGPVMVMIALRIHAERQSAVASFANNIITPQGGTHEAGFRAALLKACNRYAEENKLTKEAFVASDVAEGLVAAVSVRLSERPRFQGQTKDRLANTECQGATNSVTYQLLTKFFEENPKEAKAVIARIDRAARARSAAENARERVERASPMGMGGLPGKLSDCSSNDPSECELFIVEGDSAGGSAKDGRDRKTQAILPLRGKVLNTQKQAEAAAALKSEAILNLVLAIGCGTLDKFDLSKLRYHKIILMTDADVDGAHIRTLLLTFMQRYMRPLIEAGHVYIAMPPLYGVRKGKGPTHWLMDDAALEEFFATHGGRDAWDSPQRFKGLGEMAADQLWETTMNPETRTLMQVKPSSLEADDAVFELLMGASVPPRAAWLAERARYADIDV